MKVFAATGFKGHWPLSTSAVIVANTKAEAFRALCDLLEKEGLLQKKKDFSIKQLFEVKTNKASTTILLNGDYSYDEKNGEPVIRQLPKLGKD